MFSSLIKNLSILKKFLFINLLIFIFIGTLTIIYLNYVQPNLIKKKTSLQIEVINNTINNLNRLNIEDRKSTRLTGVLTCALPIFEWNLLYQSLYVPSNNRIGS